MGRTAGALNKDYTDARDELARRAAQALLTTGARLPSLRALAEAAEVDQGTLRHYFGDRRGVVRAALETLLVHGDERQRQALALSALPVEEALHRLCTGVVRAWSGLLGSMHATGFVEGMGDDFLGRAYVETILEPTLATVEQLLGRFVERGELRPTDLRVAALALMAPVMLACFHQVQLAGAACRPLELEPFVTAHLTGFLRGHARSPSSDSPEKSNS